MSSTEPDTVRQALAEMTTAAETVIRRFQENCPEGFDAADVAAAITDVCSDEMCDLYTAKAQNDRLRAELEQARADVRRLAVAAENGKHSLAAFVADTTDPGSAAFGALYLLQQALSGQPDTEPAYLEVTPERLRAAHFHEAARLLESAGCDDDAVNLLDNVADGIAQQYNPNPGHQPHCVAATQGCCSCEEPEPARPHCDCYSQENYGRRHDPDCLTMRANPA